MQTKATDPSLLFIGLFLLVFFHFDEREDATVFKDASGNGNTLTGHNGARIVRGKGKLTSPQGFAVHPRNKIALTWGQIKSRIEK